jgi:hypothetical protein
MGLVSGGTTLDVNGIGITSQSNGTQEALDIGINVAGVQVDPRQIRTLTATDVVSIGGTLPLPTGAATSANQTTIITDLAAINAKLGTLGQQTEANSAPVVIASNQSAIPVTTQTANGVLTDNSGTTSATSNTSTTVMAANASRKYLLIQNVATSATMWINFTTAATKSQPSIMLSAGASFSMEGGFVSTEAVTIICSLASQGYTAKQA